MRNRQPPREEGVEETAGPAARQGVRKPDVAERRYRLVVVQQIVRPQFHRVTLGVKSDLEVNVGMGWDFRLVDRADPLLARIKDIGAHVPLQVVPKCAPVIQRQVALNRGLTQ